MKRMLEGWKIGMMLILGMVLSNIPTVQLSAQVGNDPARSPYRDIPLRSGSVVFAGYLSGDRGRVGAGISNALTIGARFEVPTGRSLLLQFTAAYLNGDRFVIDPGDSTRPARRTGPVKSDLLLTEAAVQLRLTGAKSWRRLAPYVGAGLGFANELASRRDSSGYRFGTKVTVSGAAGMRWFPARRVRLDADFRALLWRLRYPPDFRTAAVDGTRVVGLDEKLTDWTLHPWISLGVGWTF